MPAFKVSLGKTLNLQLFPMGLTAHCMASATHWYMNVCMDGQIRGFVKRFGVGAIWLQSVYHLFKVAPSRYTENSSSWGQGVLQLQSLTQYTQLQQN